MLVKFEASFVGCNSQRLQNKDSLKALYINENSLPVKIIFGGTHKTSLSRVFIFGSKPTKRDLVVNNQRQTGDHSCAMDHILSFVIFKLVDEVDESLLEQLDRESLWERRNHSEAKFI